MRCFTVSVALFVGALGAVAQAGAEPPAAYEGRRLYVSYCLLCHGAEGDGDGPLAKKMDIKPASLRTTVRSRSDTVLTKIISGEGGPTVTGRKRHDILSSAMPEWQSVFGETQIKALIAYLRFLGSSKHGLMGDPEEGMELYQRYCQVCHGEGGEGDGIMTALLDIDPLDHTNPNVMNEMSNSSLVRSITVGKGSYMPAWDGILSESEVESLVSYIRLLSH